MLDDITITVGNWYYSRSSLGNNSEQPTSEIVLSGTTTFVKFIMGEPVKLSYTMHIKVASSNEITKSGYIEIPKKYENYTSIEIHAFCNEQDFTQLRDILIELKASEILSLDIFLNLQREQF